MTADDAARKQLILDNIREVPDFPKKGILFCDVTTILLNPAAFQATIDMLTERYRDQKIDVIGGFEARGLIFGAPLALALGCAFVPLRKPGKLPGDKIYEEYKTEYSVDRIEMHVGHVKPGQRVVLVSSICGSIKLARHVQVDDLIATGGTLLAGIKLIKKAGAQVVESALVIELPFLKGRQAVEPHSPVFVLVEKDCL